MPKPKAIITGGTGYIGSHVVKYLIDKGWEVAVISRLQSSEANLEDVRTKIRLFKYGGDINSLIAFMREFKADVVMHLAAAVITNQKSEHVKKLIQSNVEFGTEILEAMSLSDSRLFIGTGTYWQNYNSETYNPVDLYAATKEAFEKILKYYVEVRGIRAITLRLFDVYGEDDPRPKLLTLLRKVADTPQSLDMTEGKQLVDMVHVYDVARALEYSYDCLASDSQITNEVYGVSSGTQIELRKVVELFQQILGKQMNLNWGARPYKNREILSPYRGYKSLPNWHPTITIREGLKKFVENC